MFGRATIRSGIGPHSSYYYYNFELKPVIAAAFMRIANCPVRRMRFELTLLWAKRTICDLFTSN